MFDKKNLELIEEINSLKKENDAVIVAHNYQLDEVQEIADLVGDSYALSKYCASSDKSIIVFCGVHFMAESAKILSPEKTVLLPEKYAGCPMADMVGFECLEKKKREYPNAAVVGYINSSAKVKTLFDICCTSSNAVNVVKSLKEKQILFVPDKNLGNYISKQVPEKEFIMWEGYCITHNRIRKDEAIRIKNMHKNVELLVHPECDSEIVDLADFIGSTKQIIDYAKNSDRKAFIIGTEMGIMYQLKKDNPDKEFYLLSQSLICPNMKKTNLMSIKNALLKKEHEIILAKDIIEKAKIPLERMLKV